MTIEEKIKVKSADFLQAFEQFKKTLEAYKKDKKTI